MMLGNLQRAQPTWRGHFAPAYLVGSNMHIYSLSMVYAKGSEECYQGSLIEYTFQPKSKNNHSIAIIGDMATNFC